MIIREKQIYGIVHRVINKLATGTDRVVEVTRPEGKAYSSAAVKSNDVSHILSDEVLNLVNMSKKKVITEKEILEVPSSQHVLRVPANVIITPLARETAKQRGIMITTNSEPSTENQSDKITKVAIGSDHGGYELKEELKQYLEELGYEVKDYGTFRPEPVDYPDIALAVACAVASNECERGIIIDGAGIGSCMTANKVPGVRAALCYDNYSIKNSREHNDANVLTLGGRVIGVGLAREMVKLWLTTPFGGGRHQRRVDKIKEIERKYLK